MVGCFRWRGATSKIHRTGQEDLMKVEWGTKAKKRCKRPDDQLASGCKRTSGRTVKKKTWESPKKELRGVEIKRGKEVEVGLCLRRGHAGRKTSR